jgi:hypothetical protein
MSYIGYKPADKPLTSADITDSIITSAKIADGTIVNADINASAAIAGSKISGSFGKVLQVVSTLYTTATSQSITQNTITNVTGINVSITPSSASNKILIFCRFFGEISADPQDSMFGLKRDSTEVGGAVSAGDRTYGISIAANVSDGDNASSPETVYFHHLDSPSSTSSLTYHLTFFAKSSSRTLYINRTVTDGSGSPYFYERGSCEITAMEIAG